MTKTLTAYAAVEGDEIVEHSFFTGRLAVFPNEYWAKVHWPRDARVVPIQITYEI
jgi:hypothetical protein